MSTTRYCIARLSDDGEQWIQVTRSIEGSRGYEYFTDPDYFDMWCDRYPYTIVEVMPEAQCVSDIS